MSAEEFIKQYGLYNQYLIWKNKSPDDRLKFSNWYLNVYKKNCFTNLPNPDDFTDSHQYNLAAARRVMYLMKLNRKISLDDN